MIRILPNEVDGLSDAEKKIGKYKFKQHCKSKYAWNRFMVTKVQGAK